MRRHSFSEPKRRSDGWKKWPKRKFSSAHTFLKIRFDSLRGKTSHRSPEKDYDCELWYLTPFWRQTHKYSFRSKWVSITKALSLIFIKTKSQKDNKCNLRILTKSQQIQSRRLFNWKRNDFWKKVIEWHRLPHPVSTIQLLRFTFELQFAMSAGLIEFHSTETLIMLTMVKGMSQWRQSHKKC